jgi:GNAT superfamily N-acetyltransferase
VIRQATVSDVEALRAIERAAGEAFRSIDMATVADDEPTTAAALTAFVNAGRAWVETNSDDKPIGYILLEELDGRAHIEQVTVHPAYARRGFGAALIDEAARWAAANGLSELTLTTFAKVPWNAPYYARLGFTVLPEQDWDVGMRGRVTREAEHGLDAWPRVVMKRAAGNYTR